MHSFALLALAAIHVVHSAPVRHTNLDPLMQYSPKLHGNLQHASLSHHYKRQNPSTLHFCVDISTGTTTPVPADGRCSEGMVNVASPNPSAESRGAHVDSRLFGSRFGAINGLTQTPNQDPNSSQNPTFSPAQGTNNGPGFNGNAAFDGNQVNGNGAPDDSDPNGDDGISGLIFGGDPGPTLLGNPAPNPPSNPGDDGSGVDDPESVISGVVALLHSNRPSPFRSSSPSQAPGNGVGNGNTFGTSNGGTAPNSGQAFNGNGGFNGNPGLNGNSAASGDSGPSGDDGIGGLIFGGNTGPAFLENPAPVAPSNPGDIGRGTSDPKGLLSGTIAKLRLGGPSHSRISPTSQASGNSVGNSNGFGTSIGDTAPAANQPNFGPGFNDNSLPVSGSGGNNVPTNGDDPSLFGGDTGPTFLGLPSPESGGLEGISATVSTSLLNHNGPSSSSSPSASGQGVGSGGGDSNNNGNGSRPSENTGDASFDPSDRSPISSGAGLPGSPDGESDPPQGGLFPDPPLPHRPAPDDSPEDLGPGQSPSTDRSPGDHERDPSSLDFGPWPAPDDSPEDFGPGQSPSTDRTPGGHERDPSSLDFGPGPAPDDSPEDLGPGQSPSTDRSPGGHERDPSSLDFGPSVVSEDPPSTDDLGQPSSGDKQNEGHSDRLHDSPLDGDHPDHLSDGAPQFGDNHSGQRFDDDSQFHGDDRGHSFIGVSQSGKDHRHGHPFDNGPDFTGGESDDQPLRDNPHLGAGNSNGDRLNHDMHFDGSDPHDSSSEDGSRPSENHFQDDPHDTSPPDEHWLDGVRFRHHHHRPNHLVEDHSQQDDTLFDDPTSTSSHRDGNSPSDSEFTRRPIHPTHNWPDSFRLEAHGNDDPEDHDGPRVHRHVHSHFEEIGSGPEILPHRIRDDPAWWADEQIPQSHTVFRPPHVHGPDCPCRCAWKS